MLGVRPSRGERARPSEERRAKPRVERVARAMTIPQNPGEHEVRGPADVGKLPRPRRFLYHFARRGPAAAWFWPRVVYQAPPMDMESVQPMGIRSLELVWGGGRRAEI